MIEETYQEYKKVVIAFLQENFKMIQKIILLACGLYVLSCLWPFENRTCIQFFCYALYPRHEFTAVTQNWGLSIVCSQYTVVSFDFIMDVVNFGRSILWKNCFEWALLCNISLLAKFLQLVRSSYFRTICRTWDLIKIFLAAYSWMTRKDGTKQTMSFHSLLNTKRNMTSD